MEWIMSQQPWMQALFATCFTYMMTALGAALVFVIRRCNSAVINGMKGTAAGLMIAASFFLFCCPRKRAYPGIPFQKPSF